MQVLPTGLLLGKNKFLLESLSPRKEDSPELSREEEHSHLPEVETMCTHGLVLVRKSLFYRESCLQQIKP